MWSPLRTANLSQGRWLYTSPEWVVLNNTLKAMFPERNTQRCEAPLYKGFSQNWTLYSGDLPSVTITTRPVHVEAGN